jgi:cytidine deaminase
MTTEPPEVAPAAPGTVADPALEALACSAQRRSYAAYSKFRVGAALRASGEVFEGANIENASYGLGICAERTAMFAAVLAGARRLERVAVCTDASPPSSPCGACRQVLLEFAPDPAAVIVIATNPSGERRSWTLAELIPDGFSGKELP